MNEIIWEGLRSGFPLLIIIFYGMLVYNVWKNESFTSKTKWKWISIIVLPGLLAIATLWVVLSLESDNVQFLNIMAVILLFLPFTGVFAWLVGTR